MIRHRVGAEMLSSSLSPLTLGHLGYFQFLTVMNTWPTGFAQTCAWLCLWHFSPLSESVWGGESFLWRCLRGTGWEAPHPGTGKSKEDTAACHHRAPSGAQSACNCRISPCIWNCLIKMGPSKIRFYLPTSISIPVIAQLAHPTVIIFLINTAVTVPDPQAREEAHTSGCSRTHHT